MLTVDIPRIIAHVAGVVKEGPGMGDDDDSDDEVDPLDKERSKQPRLFTMPEIASGNLSAGAIVGAVSLTIFIIALIIFFTLTPENMAHFEASRIKFFNNFRGIEL
jgi:hypothetical protein